MIPIKTQVKLWDALTDATYVAYKLTGSFHIWGFLMACSRKADTAYMRSKEAD
jgi:hypothetical protein